MTKSALVVSILMLTAFVISAAQAQVTVEVSEITCEEFASYKVMDPEKIAIWLSGYYHGKQGNTSIDRVQLTENTKKLEEDCLKNPEILVMQAFEKLFGESK
jgi:acid stress chaperone HdeB